MARDKYIVNYCDFTNKKDRINDYISQMLNRTNKMFDIQGLPDNIDVRQLERRLQTHGYLVWFKIEDSDIVQMPDSREMKGGVYALWGGLGGVVDFNDDFTFAIVTHPRLNKSFKLKIDEDCVVMRNDSLMTGLLPLYERYATMLVENDITINMADIQSRIVSLITAGTDTNKKSADLFIENIQKGKLSVISDQPVSDMFKLNTLPYSNTASSTITNLIELQQYIKASWFNELGLSANYNMKRESINSSEAQMGQDSLRPLIDDMLHERKNAYDKINKMFGLNITCEFHTPWLQSMTNLANGEDAEFSVEGTTSSSVSDTEEQEVETEDTNSDENEEQQKYNENYKTRTKRGNI